MRHHKEIVDIDQALHSADLRKLMGATGINSYVELFENDGESRCEDLGSAHANSIIGLHNLEAQLLIEHAKLITELEKRSVMILSLHAAAVSVCFSARM